MDKKATVAQTKGKQNGDWGIFNNSSLQPVERYDPFSTYLDETGSLVGHKTFISPIRGKRPIEFVPTQIQTPVIEKPHSSTKDTFCRLINGEIPSIVITKDLSIEDDPFSTSSKDNVLHSSKAFSTVNLYPPISRVVETQESTVNKTNRYPSGLSLVHIFTNHYLYPEEISVGEWHIFLQNYSLTINSCITHPTIRKSREGEIHSFFNIGPRAGASIPHLHGQSVLYTNYSGSGSKFKSYTLASHEQKECIKCQYWKKSQINFLSSLISIKDRLLLQNDDWMAFLAYAPEKDAHIRLLPRRHVSALWHLTKGELNSLASVMVESNDMLTKFIAKEGQLFRLVKDRNIIIRQLMQPDIKHFHMFIDLLPVQQLGGIEILDNQKISSTFPETISHKMRSLT